MRIVSLFVFSMPGCAALVAALCIAVSVMCRVDVIGIAFSIAVGGFIYGKLAYLMSLQQGYGVKQGVKSMLGMPLLVLAFVAVAASVITALLVLVYQPSTLQAETLRNIRAIGWSAASGVLVAICHWYFYARQAYFYQSEYNIRMECRARGDSQEATDAAVAFYRSNGIVR